jgi:NAD(P)-dependent dehydrogenase (short-subunit alcohol dehydrogenase family)
MQGKICMVTGASSGIGKAIAVKLAAMGATVVAVCRERGRGQTALREIKEASGSETVELMIADLSSQAAIRKLAEDYKRTHSQLHVLVNNAGINCGTFSKTVDGIETTFAVNHLAPFLLTNLLFDTLKASAPARIINLLGWEGTLDFDNLMSDKHYNGMEAYRQSNAARTLFTRELAKRLEGIGVTANCVTPGFARTNLGRDVKGLFKLFLTMMRPFMISPDKGAETPVYLASAPEVADVTGQTYANKMAQATTAYDEAAALRLWQISAEFTGQVMQPEKQRYQIVTT